MPAQIDADKELKGLKSYHIAWLSIRPHRTGMWLLERLADGFDIHHIDFDHQNDAPDNLILLEYMDHMRLHGVNMLGRLLHGVGGPRPKTMSTGKKAYNFRKAGFGTWKEIGAHMGG